MLAGLCGGLGRQFGADTTMTDQTTGGGFAQARTRLRLDLRVGTGQIGVRR